MKKDSIIKVFLFHAILAMIIVPFHVKATNQGTQYVLSGQMDNYTTFSDVESETHEVQLANYWSANGGISKRNNMMCIKTKNTTGNINQFMYFDGSLPSGFIYVIKVLELFTPDYSGPSVGLQGIAGVNFGGYPLSAVLYTEETDANFYYASEDSNYYYAIWDSADEPDIISGFYGRIYTFVVDTSSNKYGNLIRIGFNSYAKNTTFKYLCPYGYTYEAFLPDDYSAILGAIEGSKTSITNSIYSTSGSVNANIDEMKYRQDITNGKMDESINQQQQTNGKLDQANQELGNLNSNITNSDTTEASGSADSFFSGFESNDYGLSSIITAPLNLIKSITSSTCTPIGFKAPFVNQQVTLPCMSSIYKDFFGGFLTIYQTITFGMVAYWVSVNIFGMVKGFKDPDSDRIEVLDL